MLQHDIYALGDQAITISFGEHIDNDLNDHCIRTAEQLRKQNISAVTEVIAAYCTITVLYDAFQLREHPSPQAFIIQQIERSLRSFNDAPCTMPGRQIQIPVCYDPAVAPDLEAFISTKNISMDRLIQLHTSVQYKVYMLGFLPGFPYLGKVLPELVMPRKNTPHLNVAAGSVGIAGEQTGIYPLDSPGGWNIIGRTPVKMFDAQARIPAYLQQGDMVSFYPVDLSTFKQMQQ